VPGGVDVNRDRLRDLVCLFAKAKTGLAVADTTGILNGRTKVGTPFVGRDSITILKK
jgi:hypothetical protein